MGSIQMNYRENERGNVLFLILIAVALFAALSYAVTQSTRSGGGSADRETALLSGASMTQYPASLRTSLVRMVLAGVQVNQLEFNTPSDFGLGTINQMVFHPNGGGAVYQQSPANLMANGAQGTWTFNGDFELVNIGITNAGGNDIIAFLPGVSQAVCESVNDRFGINDAGCTLDAASPIPTMNISGGEANAIDNQMVTGYTLPATDMPNLANATCTAFDGQPSGCFYDDDNSRHVFYSVLLER